MPPKNIKKPKQAVNQFVHSKKTQPSKRTSDENCENGIEITSKYPKKNGRIIVREKDMKNVWVQLLITNHFSNSVVFNNLTKNKENIPIKSTKIPSGESVSYKIEVSFHDVGLDHVYIHLKFDFLNEGDGHNITKKINISAQLQNPEVETLQPMLPYKRPPDALIRKGNAPVIIYPAPPVKSKGMNNLPKINIEKYPIPDNIRKMVNHGLEEESPPSRGKGSQNVSGKFKTILASQLTKENYQETFKYLLYLEELQAEIALDRNTIEKTPMFLQEERENGISLQLEIAGIIDSNSFCKYETLCVRYIKEDGTLSQSAYEGNIEKMNTSSIIILFGRKLAEIYHDEMEFQVKFYPSRYTFRLQHRALQLVKDCNLWPVLFPDSKAIGQIGTNPQKIQKFFNEDIKKNPEQQTAVRNIVSGFSRPCPYIIFGPPGTGKTSTLVEAMKQVISLSPHSRILACAFSNSAANILARKLLDFPPKIEIFRMYATSFDPNSIPEDLLDISNFSEKYDDYVYPSLEKLKTFHVVVCTVTTAARLSSCEVMKNFSHIFIDESGFCMEPELIVAFAGILDVSKAQLVLTGDHKQLGPIVRSPFATAKLNVSLLERLMTTFPVYQRQENGKYNPKVVTKLLKNYRSHPAILKVSNDLFYDNELQACGNVENIYRLCELPILPKNKFPLILHSIVGEEQREGNCPSYFNAEESLIVVDYIKKLCKYDVSPCNIGVITPYCKQVQKINILLQKNKIKKVKVNSVEKFLGDERMVIIISTVRSNPENQEDDYTNPMLGFLSNKKRFNVAVSRPQALLIVVGNVKCLCNDNSWLSLFSYCSDNEAIKAEGLSAKEEAIQYIFSRQKK